MIRHTGGSALSDTSTRSSPCSWAKHWAEFIATKIKLAQTNAAVKVNAEMLALYWELRSYHEHKKLNIKQVSKSIFILMSVFALSAYNNSKNGSTHNKNLKIQLKR